MRPRVAAPQALLTVRPPAPNLRIGVRARAAGLDPDFDIRFAIAVTLEIEAEVNYDIHAEIREKIEQRARAAAGVRV